MKSVLISLLTLLWLSNVDGSIIYDGPPEFLKGTYGYSSEYNVVVLTINDDQTFTYINNTNSKKPIEVSGIWVQRGRFIRLMSNHLDGRFPRRWSIDPRHDCLRSGFSKGQFIRLCHTGNCNPCD